MSSTSCPCRGRGTRETERQVYMNALEQVRLADELGFDSVWAVEHHFLEEYSHCSAPELFLTAVRGADAATSASATASSCASRSSTTRSASPSGRPCSTSSPAAASSSAPAARRRGPSSAASAPTPTTTKKTWDEFVHAIPQMWMNERFGYEGEFFSMPDPRRAAQAVPEAAPADVGRRVVARAPSSTPPTAAWAPSA